MHIGRKKSICTHIVLNMILYNIHCILGLRAFLFVQKKGHAVLQGRKKYIDEILKSSPQESLGHFQAPLGEGELKLLQ